MAQLPFGNKGYVTLLSVLILGAVATSVGVGLLLMGTSFSKSSFTLVQSFQSQALADACLEEALQQMQDSVPFTGSGSLTFGQGSCAYTVTAGAGQNRTATASATVGTVVRKAKLTLDKIRPSPHITSWQEVADF